LETKTTLQNLRDEIEKATKKDFEILSKENDEVKKLRILMKIQKNQTKIFLEKLKNLTNNDFESLLIERGDEIVKNRSDLMSQIDSTVFDLSQNQKDYEKYKKMKKMQEKHGLELFNLINEINVSKKILERFLAIKFIDDAQDEL